MRRVWTLALFAAVLAFAGQSALPATANSKLIGVHHRAGPLSNRDLGRMDRGGVSIVRQLLYWRRVQPHKKTFHWGATDAIVGKLASRGIQLLPIVYGSPRFVARNPAVPPVRSAHKRRLWRQFLRKAVNRYGPGGRYWTTPTLYPRQHPGSPAEPVRAWQIWNEPNLAKFFAPHPSVHRYARLVRSSHQAIKGAGPPGKVILAGLSGRGDPPARRFLARFYGARHIKGSFDAVAVNPYATTASGVGSQIRQIRAVMAQHRDKRTGVWVTELGWGSHPPDRFGLNKGLKGQKRILERSFKVILHHRRGWHVKRLIWFDYRDPSPHRGGGCSFCDSAGLLRHSGKPKPAWRAFKRFTGAGR